MLFTLFHSTGVEIVVIALASTTGVTTTLLIAGAAGASGYALYKYQKYKKVLGSSVIN